MFISPIPRILQVIRGQVSGRSDELFGVGVSWRPRRNVAHNLALRRHMLRNVSQIIKVERTYH